YGDCIVVKNKAGEISSGFSGPSAASHQFTWNKSLFARVNTSWKINTKNQLNLTIAPTFTTRTGDDLYLTSYDPSTAKRQLLNWVNGLEYKTELLDGKLENIAFLKSYTQGI